MTDQDTVFGPAYRSLSIGILVSVSAVAVEAMAVATILPVTAADLGGFDAYGWAFSAFMLSSLVGAIATGQAIDRRNPVGPTRLAFATFALGLLVGGFAPAWPVLLLGRVLQGFGGGGLGAVAYLAVARGYPEALRPRLLALLASAWVLPALLAPAVAGQVAEHFSWRFVFLGIIPLSACGATLLLPALGRLEPLSPSPGPPGRLGAALRLAAGLGLLLWGLGLDTAAPALLVVAVGALVAALALRTLLPGGTATARPGLPAAVATRGLLACGFFGAEAHIPLGLATVRGVPPSEVGLALTAGGLAWVCGSWIQNSAETHQFGPLPSRRWRVRIGLGLIGLGIAAVAVVILGPAVPVVLGIVAWALAGLGMGLSYSALTLTALGASPLGQEGSTSASLQLAETVGIAVGTGAGGALLALAPHLQQDLAAGLGWGFVLTAGVTLLGLAPAMRLLPVAAQSRVRPAPASASW